MAPPNASALKQSPPQNEMASLAPPDVGAAKVSAVIITLNEQHVIQECLAHVSWCDEIVIVDSGSTDKTLEICESFGARIYHRDFDGYGSQKQFAVSMASHDWVLSIDADEIVTAELATEILSVLKTTPPTAGYRLRFSTYFLDRRLRFGPTRNEEHLRLFKQSQGGFDRAAVHERIVLEGQIATLDHQIVHHPYRDLAEYLHKMNAYTEAAAQQYFRKGRNHSKFLLPLRFPIMFVLAYVFRGGFLDGYPGFLWSFLHATYGTAKYAKLIELRDQAH